MDSGIAAHEDLVIAGGINVVGTALNNVYTDTYGHGTHVAGIVAGQNNTLGYRGVAPGVNLYGVRVFADENGGSLSDVLEGLDWCITNEMDLINMSFGDTQYSPALEQMINEAYAAGITLVAASGNEDNGSHLTDTILYPARLEKVIAVGSIESNGSLSSFSSSGAALDVVAPGGIISSTLPGNRYGSGSGTSMAAPYVTGLLALYLEQYPGSSNGTLKQLLVSNAIDLGVSGFDSLYGAGLVQWKTDYSGIYVIRSKNSNLAMDVFNGGRDNGTNIIQWPAHGGLNQQWRFQRTVDGYYTLTSVLNPQYSIDVYGGGTTIGNRVIQYTSLPHQINQKWKLVKNSDGSMSFMSQLAESSGTGYLLDVYGGGTTAGVNVIQWQGHYGNNQRWYLEPVH